jgi:pyruvate,water dikinase
MNISCGSTRSGLATLVAWAARTLLSAKWSKNFSNRGIKVPEGFATTTAAYAAYLSDNWLAPELRARLDALKLGKASLRETGAAIRQLFLSGEFPGAVSEAIRSAYRELCRRSGGEASVAVCSSATAEDLPDASFAGQQETFINVRGERELLESCRRCFAPLFTDRAITYRELKGLYIRSPQGRAFDRDSADGPRRQGRLGRDVLNRHGVRVSRRGRD